MFERRFVEVPAKLNAKGVREHIELDGSEEVRIRIHDGVERCLCVVKDYWENVRLEV